MAAAVLAAGTLALAGGVAGLARLATHHGGLPLAGTAAGRGRALPGAGAAGSGEGGSGQAGSRAAGSPGAGRTGAGSTGGNPPGGAGLGTLPPGKIGAPPRPPPSPRAAPPVALMIPAIGVRTPLVRLGLTAQGALGVPASAQVAGWYTGSPRPGEVGPAIIAGHIDSVAGPGVFYRLHLLRPGDRVYVRRADGTAAVFRVDGLREYAKSRFPTGQVYGPVPDAELRLITCGGTFDYATGSYLSNVVVYGRLVR